MRVCEVSCVLVERIKNAERKKVGVAANPRIYDSQATTPPFRSAERLSGTSELFWMTKNKQIEQGEVGRSVPTNQHGRPPEPT